MSNFSTSGDFVDQVDPRLLAILRETANRSGRKVVAHSGYREGDKRQHGRGNATDISLFDDNGNELPDYQDPKHFGAYEKFAKQARAVQKEMYPELSEAFRWGGYFSGDIGKKGKYGAMDLMHFDVGGTKEVGMGAGSWAGGVDPKWAAKWGVPSTAGIQQPPISTTSSAPVTPPPNTAIRDNIVRLAAKRGIKAEDLATVISYETGGTFDPFKRGPTTQWGQHIGLIQMGEDQRNKYGFKATSTIDEQFDAMDRYFDDAGVKPGTDLNGLYAAINAGNVNNVNATDENNGGAPGTVLDKVAGMGAHQAKGRALLEGSLSPAPVGDVERSDLAEAGPTPPRPYPDERSNPLSDANVPIPYSYPPPVQFPDEEQPSLWELQKDAYNTDQTLPWLMSGNEYAPDPNWSLTSERVQKDMEGLGVDPDEWGVHLGESVSEASYLENLDRVKVNSERLNRLQNAGMTGTALRMANSMLDPIQLGADVAASAFVPQLVLGKRATTLGRILYAGLGGAAGGAAGAGVSYAVNPNTTKADLLVGTVLGFGVGGAFGALSKNPHASEEAYAIVAAARRTAMEHQAGTAPNMGASVGAAQAQAERRFLKDDAIEYMEDKDIDPTFGRSMRMDLFAMLDKSKNPAVRFLAGLVQDGTGKRSAHTINAIAPSEEKALFVDQWMTSYHRTYSPSLKDFLEERGSTFKDRGLAEAKFNEEIDDYIRDITPDRGEKYSKSVKMAGDKIASMMDDIVRQANNPMMRDGLYGRSVAGFENVQPNKHYMPRYWDPQRVVLATTDFGQDNLDALIAGAIRKANPDIDEALLAVMSKGFMKAVVNRSHGIEDMAVRALGDADIEKLADDVLGLTGSDRDKLFDYFQKKGEPAEKDVRAKQRVLMHEDFRLEGVIDKNGVSQSLGIRDLIVRDASGTMRRYVDHMSGAIALSRYRVKDPVTGELIIDGITSDKEFEKLISVVRKRGADEMQKGRIKDLSSTDQDVKRLQFAYSSIRGRPVNDMEGTNIGWYLRALRRYNFSRIMNQVGFAQAAEVGAIVGSLGTKAAFSQLPALKRIKGMDGETMLKSGFADDLETWFGAGTERMRHSTEVRYDDLTGPEHVPGQSWKSKADNLLNKANRVTSEVSGMTQANIMLERWVYGAAVQRFANWAAKGGKGINPARLTDLGLDQAMATRVRDMINAEGNLEFTKGFLTGKKVTRLHMDKWKDKEAATAFTNAIYRQARSIVQKNDIGNLVMWMSHPVAKVLMQFRTFMMGAYTKQTMKSLKMRDRQSVAVAMWSSVVASMVYMAQTQLQSIGRSDREEFLADRLTMRKIATAGFARSGPSSIMPMMIDTANAMAGQDAVFGHTRTTGQVSQMFLGNPGMGLVFDEGPKVTSSLVNFGKTGEWSQEESRGLARTLPFGNALPLVMGLNAFISGLPERAARD